MTTINARLGMRLSAFLLLLVIAPAPPGLAQDVGPADCPAIEDSEGERVGPVVSLGLHNASATTQAVEEDQALPIVAIAVDGEVYLLGAMRERLVGTLVRDRTLLFDGADCSGTPHVLAHDYFDPGPVTWQGSGPVPVSAVVGPEMTLWTLDRDQPPVDFTLNSVLGYWNEDPRAERCFGRSPTELTATPLRRVVDLADHFSPPFRLIDGRCPNPGRGGR